MARRYGQKRELTSDHTKALSQINQIIKGLGIGEDEIAKTKQDLTKYMPKNVFFDRFGPKDIGKTKEGKPIRDTKGLSLLYSIYAPQIVNDFFKEERGAKEKRQSPKSRRIQYEEMVGDYMDYVQSVFMGYHDDQDTFQGGIQSLAIPSQAGSPNIYAYDPTMKDSRPWKCPHCNVSFWSKSAGNCDPQYQHINGQPVREWRESEDEAPEHIRFNPSTGERIETGGYSYCGGRHPIYDITTADGVDIERAEKLSGLNWDTLQAKKRIRSIASGGTVKYYLVDPYLDEVEKKLGGGGAYKTFGPDWIFEKDGELYRECRHPITLKSPHSMIHDRISRYTYNVSDKRSSGRAHRIKVYMCPLCQGEFKDVEDTTTTKGSKDPVTIVRCDDCGQPFDITKLSEDMVYTMMWIDPQVSLNIRMQDEEGHTSELIDTIPRRDLGYLEIEMADIFKIFEREIEAISHKLGMRGAEHAKDIFEDWVLNNYNLKELTHKYFPGIYRLHFTQCLDCGYTIDEKANPPESMAASYKQGIPVAMTSCPNRSDPRHRVQVTPPKTQVAEPTKPAEQDEWGQFANKEIREEMTTERPQEAAQQKQEQQTADLIDDTYERRKFLGLNIVYHGCSEHDEEGVSQVGQSWLPDMERGTSEKLPPNDPRAYKGEDGIITRYPYHPSQRLIKAIVNALKSNPQIRAKHEEVLETLDKWTKELFESSNRIAKVRGFCKTGK